MSVIIESIQDWNSAMYRGAGYGHELPIHDQAVIDYQVRPITWVPCGYTLGMIQAGVGIVDLVWPDDVPCPDRAAVYRKLVITDVSFDPPETKIGTWIVQPFSQYTDTGFPEDVVHTGDDTTPPYSVSEIELSDPVSMTTVISEADITMRGSAWIDEPLSESAYFLKTYATCGDAVTEYPSLVQMSDLRFKVGVEENYPGTYFNAKWDEVFYPRAWVTWDDADPETRGAEPTGPSILRSREWTYSNDKSSEWFTVNRPTEEGWVHIRNMRTLSYRTPWGNAPNFQGERFVKSA